MKCLFKIAFFTLLMKSHGLNAQIEIPTWTKDKVTEEQFYSIGTQAYIYSIAPFMLYSVIYQTQQIPYESYSNGVPFNVWTKMKALGNSKNTKQAMPNVNTLYASTWLDLRKEPILLDVPAMGERYFSIGLQDAYMNYFSIIGSRTIGGYGGKFAICAPTYNGVIPKDYQRVDAPTPFVWMLMRIAPQLAIEAEVEKCIVLQDKVTITPLSQMGNGAYNPNTYNLKLDLGSPDISKDPLDYFKIVNRYMQINTPPKGEAALMEMFKEIGFTTEKEFEPSALSPSQRSGLLKAMNAGKEMVNTAIVANENLYNGWTMPSTEVGNYGYKYLSRAAMTMQSIGILPWEEALYIVGYKDIQGNELNGSNNYVLHFTKEELPKVNAFWSLTLYDLPSIMLYDNAINRYQMGPQIENMAYNADGSLTIYIQHQQPKEKAKQNNWLPAPSGKFMLSLRLYNPKSAMLGLQSQQTPLPGVKLVK